MHRKNWHSKIPQKEMASKVPPGNETDQSTNDGAPILEGCGSLADYEDHNNRFQRPERYKILKAEDIKSCGTQTKGRRVHSNWNILSNLSCGDQHNRVFSLIIIQII